MAPSVFTPAGTKIQVDNAPTAQIITGSGAVGDVTGMTVVQKNGTSALSWSPVIDLRSLEYEIRKGSSYSSAQVLGTTPLTELNVSEDGIYWVTAKAGSKRSEIPASVQVIGSTLPDNVIAEYDEDWSGALENLSVVGDAIRLTGIGDVRSATDIRSIADMVSYGGVSPQGTYTIPSNHQIDVGQESLCNVSMSHELHFSTMLDNIHDWVDAREVEDVRGDWAQFVGATPQMRMAGDDLVFGNWQNFVPGQYLARKFDFGILLTSSHAEVAASLESLHFSVDVPDRDEKASAIAISSTGNSILYAKPFIETPNLQVTLTGATEGDHVQISNETEAGFDVGITNNGNPVSGTINYLARGY